MKTLISLLLVTALYQPSKLTIKDCEKIWKSMDSAILSRNMKSTLSYFTDSMVQHYSNSSSKSLEQLITNKWFNEKHFMAAMTGKKYEFFVEGPDVFRVHVTVQFPKKPDEEGDGTLVYVLKFRKIDAQYKVYEISRIG
jgi:hypothetical protein